MMKKGDVVKVYQKPITEEDFEGWATLVQQVRPDVGDGLSMWEVYFLDQRNSFRPRDTYLRTIYQAVA